MEFGYISYIQSIFTLSFCVAQQRANDVIRKLISQGFRKMEESTMEGYLNIDWNDSALSIHLILKPFRHTLG